MFNAIHALGEGGDEVADVAAGSVGAPQEWSEGPKCWKWTIIHGTRSDEAIVELAVGAGFAGDDAFDREGAADG